MAAKESAAASDGSVKDQAEKAGSAENGGSQDASAVSPPEGKVDVGDDTGFIADLVAQSRIAGGVKQLAGELNGELDSDSHVLLVEDRDLIAGDWVYGAVHAQLSAAEQALREARKTLRELTAEPDEAKRVEPCPEPPQEAVPGPAMMMSFAVPSPLTLAPAVTGAVGEAAKLAEGLAGWMRADYTIRARAVKVGKTPLLAALSGHLLGKAGSLKSIGLSPPIPLSSATTPRSWRCGTRSRRGSHTSKRRLWSQAPASGRNESQRWQGSRRR